MARRKASAKSAETSTTGAAAAEIEEAPKPKRSPGRPRAPRMATYRFKKPGATEGASGDVWTHGEEQERTHLVDGNKVRWYEVEAPEGEFDHLYTEDGSSRYLLDKKQ